MKQRIFWIFCLFSISALFQGQQISTDSLLAKAQTDIYENPENSISIAKDLLKREKNPDHIFSIYTVLSTAYIAQRNFDESLKYILKAKETINETKDIKKKISVLISIAIQYQQMELFNKSFETLDEAQSLITEYPENDPTKYHAIGRIFAIRGMIFKSQGNSEIALEKLLTSIQNFEKSTPSKSVFANMSVVLYNIGYCYLELEKPQKAASYFIKSNDYAKKIEAKSLEAFALKGLAETYTLNGNHTEAISLLEKSQNLSKNIGDLVLNEGIYRGLADNYLVQNDFQKYQLYNKMAQNTKFEREQSELKSINSSIDVHTNENQKKIKELKDKYLLYNCIAFGFGMTVIGFLFWLIQKNTRKNKKYSEEIAKLIRG